MHLVLVHLGEASAPHLWLNITRIRKLFPTLSISLIYSDERFLSKRNIDGLSLYKYKLRGGQNNPLDKLTHNMNFRKGFWRFSIERLYALAEWHNNYPNENLIHFESDVLPMPNFPFDKFSRMEKIAWCRFNETHDVASIVYSPNNLETEWLANELDKTLSANNQLTDMTSLSVIHKYNSTRVAYLNSEELEEYFEGIFDAAPFGMWLAGRDPRNHLGFIRRFMKLPESEVTPEQYRFTYTRKGNICLTDSAKATKKLYNLHVHSKSNLLFGRFWRVNLAYLVATSRISFPNISYSPKAFIKLFFDYRRRHTDLNICQQISKVLHYK